MLQGRPQRKVVLNNIMMTTVVISIDGAHTTYLDVS